MSDDPYGEKGAFHQPGLFADDTERYKKAAQREDQPSEWRQPREADYAIHWKPVYTDPISRSLGEPIPWERPEPEPKIEAEPAVEPTEMVSNLEPVYQIEPTEPVSYGTPYGSDPISRSLGAPAEPTYDSLLESTLLDDYYMRYEAEKKEEDVEAREKTEAVYVNPY